LILELARRRPLERPLEAERQSIRHPYDLHSSCMKRHFDWNRNGNIRTGKLRMQSGAPCPSESGGAGEIGLALKWPSLAETRPGRAGRARLLSVTTLFRAPSESPAPLWHLDESDPDFRDSSE
jgi:hypothetical protein